jgi:uncharacterized protein with ATP-grasp and redox domains
MLINENCIKCQIRKNLNAYPAGTSQDLVEIYQSRVRDILDRCYGLSTPQVAEKMYDLRRELFGADKDYSEIKSYYNRLMLSLLPHMEQKVQAADDPLAMAVQYAMVGNYIDFGAMESVDEDELRAQLDQTADIVIDADVLDSFRKDILSAHHMVYFTDNCGEIVTDKLLISVIRSLAPDLSVTVILRSKEAVNDATIEDARQIRMEETANRVIGNGNGMPGNVISEMSREAMDEIEKADIMVSKGQGNFEGLSGCGLNIYYLFLCKCEAFMKRFNVPQFTGIMTKETLYREI